jgi:hypothetical protein
MASWYAHQMRLGMVSVSSKLPVYHPCRSSSTVESLYVGLAFFGWSSVGSKILASLAFFASVRAFPFSRPCLTGRTGADMWSFVVLDSRAVRTLLPWALAVSTSHDTARSVWDLMRAYVPIAVVDALSHSPCATTGVQSCWW